MEGENLIEKIDKSGFEEVKTLTSDVSGKSIAYGVTRIPSTFGGGLVVRRAG